MRKMEGENFKKGLVLGKNVKERLGCQKLFHDLAVVVTLVY
jgi:hypothetical protein